MAKSTAQAHRRALRQLSALPEDLRDLPVGKALVEWFSRVRGERRWQWTTTVTRMASTHGALRLLPLYTAAPHTILLKQDPTWVMAMRAAACLPCRALRSACDRPHIRVSAGWHVTLNGVRAWRGQHEIEVVLVHGGGATDPRQVRIDFGHHQRTRQPARDDGVHGVQGEVVVARER